MPSQDLSGGHRLHRWPAQPPLPPQRRHRRPRERVSARSCSRRTLARGRTVALLSPQSAGTNEAPTTEPATRGRPWRSHVRVNFDRAPKDAATPTENSSTLLRLGPSVPLHSNRYQPVESAKPMYPAAKPTSKKESGWSRANRVPIKTNPASNIYIVERALTGLGSTPSVSCLRSTSLSQRPIATAVTAALLTAIADQATTRSACIRSNLMPMREPGLSSWGRRVSLSALLELTDKYASQA